uniref:BUD22 domain-containing protein n=1 Tax=Caenorhabditis tropicalis TaxID=1561998 RepID=A0A1I7SYE6_9PELO
MAPRKSSASTVPRQQTKSKELIKMKVELKKLESDLLHEKSKKDRIVKKHKRDMEINADEIQKLRIKKDRNQSKFQ